MLFSIIYEFDCPREVSVKRYIPPKRDLWTQTEGDEQYEYGYLEGRWEKGKHRKFAAILTKEQFCKFVDHLYLYSEETETMGSLGAPGFGIGWRRQSRSAAMTTTQSKAPTSPAADPK